MEKSVEKLGTVGYLGQLNHIILMVLLSWIIHGSRDSAGWFATSA